MSSNAPPPVPGVAPSAVPVEAAAVTNARLGITEALRGSKSPIIVEPGEGLPNALNPQAMQDELAAFLEEHFKGQGLEYNQMMGATTAYYGVGQAFNALSQKQLALSDAATAKLQTIRAGLDPAFLSLLQAHYQELERRLGAIVKAIATQGHAYVMDDEGFRNEGFVQELQEALQFIVNDFTKLCTGTPIDRAMVPDSYFPLIQHLRGRLEGKPKDEAELRMLLESQGIDPERAIPFILSTCASERRHYQFINSEDGADRFLITWFKEELEQMLKGDSPDPDQIRQKLLILIRLDLRNRRNDLAGQTLINFDPSQPQDPADDPQGSRMLDFIPTEPPQPHLRLGSVEFLLRLLNSALRSLETVACLKTYLGLTDH